MEPKDEIKARIDVADLVGEYLTLRKAGSGSFKALCPFHGEKTPSLHVSKEKEIWHCFGCHKGGDIFSFVMEIEGMNFPEAMRFLGKKAGVEIPEYRPVDKKKASEKEALLGIHEMAGAFYEKHLWESEAGKIARDYLASRGISEDLSRKFGLGYAPDGWSVFCDAAKKKGITESTLVLGGLGKKKRSGTGVIDQFRHRLVVPLRDARGAIVGFTGRLIDDTEGPKYLNTPETPIYSKRRILFGLSLAKVGIRRAKSVIVSEGNLDVIASHKAEVEHIVASSGTALTELQLKQLKKLTDSLVFCFDSDTAGFNAARKGIHLAWKLGFAVSVISIPEELGADPDDVVQKDPEVWKRIVENPVPVMQYYFDRMMKDGNPWESAHRARILSFMTSELAMVEDPIGRDFWEQKLADVTRYDLAKIRDMVKKNRQEASTNKKNAVTAKKADTKEETVLKMTPELRTFQNLLSLLFANLALAKEYIPRIDVAWLPSEELQEVYKALVLGYTADQNPETAQKTLFTRLLATIEASESVLHLVRESMMQSQLLAESMPANELREELNRQLHQLQQTTLKRRRHNLEAGIREAERNNDAEKLQKLLAEYQQLLAQ